MVNHKLIFQTFVDAVLKSMRLATKDDSFNWKSLGFVGAQKVANSLQTQVTGNEDNTQFSVSCKQFRHEFKVEDTTFHYTREDKSGKMKFQFKEFDELRAEFWKMKMEDEHFESMKEVLEERKEVKAMEEFKWRETLKRNPKSVKLKKQKKKELRRLNQKYPKKGKSKTSDASGTEASGTEATGTEESETEASETEATGSEVKDTEETETEESETEATDTEAKKTEETETEESETEAKEAGESETEESKTSKKPETSESDTE